MLPELEVSVDRPRVGGGGYWTGVAAASTNERERERICTGLYDETLLLGWASGEREREEYHDMKTVDNNIKS